MKRYIAALILLAGIHFSAYSQNSLPDSLIRKGVKAIFCYYECRDTHIQDSIQIAAWQAKYASCETLNDSLKFAVNTATQDLKNTIKNCKKDRELVPKLRGRLWWAVGISVAEAAVIYVLVRQPK